MNITNAFEAWQANPTHRTRANLIQEMRKMSQMLDDCGILPQWHEGLNVNCHAELVELMNILRGEHVRFAAA